MATPNKARWRKKASLQWRDAPEFADGASFSQIAYDGPNALIVYGDEGEIFWWTVEDRNNSDYKADGTAATAAEAKAAAEAAHLADTGGQMGMFSALAAAKLPAGWSVEMLGLINAVRFSDGSKSLLWSDGQWTIEQNGVVMPAPGVPTATDQKSARAAGTAWLNEVFSAEAAIIRDPDPMKPELITWDEWEMNGSSNYGLGYAAGQYRDQTFGEACQWAHPTDIDEFERGFTDARNGAPRMASKLAWGEVKAPTAIDTLRIKDCPVCGEDESWDGDGRCRVCGYLPPPEPFREPDLEVAQKADMRDGPVNPDLFKAPAFKEPEPEDKTDEATAPPEEDPPKHPVQSSVSPLKYQRHQSVQGDPMRPTVATAARQQQIIRIQAERITQLEAELRKRADVDNPAQPVPEPGATAPEETTDETRPADANVEVTTPGGVMPAPAADAQTEPTTPGGVMDAPPADQTTDVTAPVSGGVDVPVADVRTEVDVETGGETIGENYIQGDWANTTAAVQARTFASLRLARLRLQAGIAEGDDITLAQKIAASKVSDGEIRTEIDTLSAVQRTAARRPGGPIRQQASRIPSLVSTASPVVAVAAPSMDPSADEFLFD